VISTKREKQTPVCTRWREHESTGGCSTTLGYGARRESGECEELVIQVDTSTQQYTRDTLQASSHSVCLHPCAGHGNCTQGQRIQRGEMDETKQPLEPSRAIRTFQSYSRPSSTVCARDLTSVALGLCAWSRLRHCDIKTAKSHDRPSGSSITNGSSGSDFLPLSASSPSAQLGSPRRLARQGVPRRRLVQRGAKAENIRRRRR